MAQGPSMADLLAAIGDIKAEMRAEASRANTRMDAIVSDFTQRLDPNSVRYYKKDDEDEGYESDHSTSMYNQRIDDRGIKLEDFDGSGEPEEYLEWERQVEKVGEYKGLDNSKIFKIAYIRLVKGAGTWFENLKAKRKRIGKSKIETWSDLKRKMRAKYVPSDFEQEQFIKLTNLTQDSMTVTEYIGEHERLYALCDLTEKEPLRIARFLKGLNRSISKRCELQPKESYYEVCKFALKVEKHNNEEKSKFTRGYTPNSKMFTPNKPRSEAIASSSKGEEHNLVKKWPEKKTEVQISKEEAESRIKCFKCQGRGHVASRCPSRRTLTIDKYYEMEEEEKHYIFITKDDEEGRDTSEEEEEEGETYAEHANLRSLVLRKIMLTETNDLSEQRENLFHTRCKVKDRTCNVIIDSGSCTNVASSEMVHKLGLPTRDHCKPYKLSWLDESKGSRVKKQALVTFSIGNYKEELWCDVIPMSACHLLLGRPWQYDRKVIHEGDSNTYSFLVGKKQIKLMPMSPKDYYANMKQKVETHPNLLISPKELTVELKENGVNPNLPIYLLPLKKEDIHVDAKK